MSKFKTYIKNIHFNNDTIPAKHLQQIQDEVNTIPIGTNFVTNRKFKKVTQKAQLLEKLRYLNTQPGFKRGIIPMRLASLCGFPLPTTRRILREYSISGEVLKIQIDKNTNKYRIKEKND